MNEMNAALKTTHALIGFIESSLKIRMHAEGVEHIPNDRPILFVINHFTRLETFLIPRIIYQHTGRVTRSLGDSTLFSGAFGKYLRACGVLPTNEPGRNRIIVGDLMSGNNDWVIYPEGSMVKSKKVYEDGEWLLDLPHHDSPRSPHTGSAVLALKAAIHRFQYKEAEKNKHDTLLSSLHERYRIESGFHIADKGPVIIPVNISYYPIRPGKNAISMLAQALTKGLPRKIEEELEVEGSLLCETTDISIYFGKAIEVDKFIQPWYGMSKKLLPFVPEQKRINMLVGSQKNRLMKRFMREIYENVSVNFDHIYCMALRRCRKHHFSEDDFLAACYCAAMRIRDFDHRRIHPTLREHLVHIITDKNYEPLKSIRECAIDEGLVTVENGNYKIDRELQREKHGFHEIRLKHPVGVIANEIEPLRKVVEVIDNTVNQPSVFIHKKVAKMVMDLDQEEFTHDYEAYYDADQSKPPEIGKPFFLPGTNSDLGIVLCHGYLAAPAEVRELAQHLNQQGYSVYAVRLRGHGTAPCNLGNISWDDWYTSYLRGVAVVSQLCERVVFAGFS
ncbi:MAG: alpha/beta hydrolase, partial [Planctomycetes bacterium]|nr:alpha/beta hydrolase [Planctomycetota bacterium]